jgi:branched-chain amino acid transport system substrate-binding protein
MRSFARAVRFATIALAAVAALRPGAGAQPVPYTMDVILPLTGPGAFVGKADAQIFDAFEKYANDSGGLRGQPIHFDIRDDQSNPQVGVQLTADIVSKHRPVLFGSGVAATCASISTLVKDKGPVQYCLSPGITPEKNSYTFATGSSLDSIARGILNYVRLSGVKRFALLNETDATGTVNTKSINFAIQSPAYAALKLVAEEHFNPGDLTVNAQAVNIKNSGAEFVMVSGSGPAFATALRGLYEAGVRVPVYTTANNMVADQLKQYGAFLPNVLLFNGFPYQAADSLRNAAIRDRVAAFSSAFKKIGVEPAGLHVLSWDAPNIVLSALRSLGPNATPDQLRSYIANLHGFVGINGTYDFRSGDQHGLGPDAVVIVRWDPGKSDVVPVSDLGGRPLR